MNVLKNLFGKLKISFIIKAYIIGLIVYGFFIYVTMFSQEPYHVNIGLLIFFTINLLIYPFSLLVLNDLQAVISDNLNLGTWVFGGCLLIAVIILKITYYFLMFTTTFMFAILIAPLGILYLYLRGLYYSGRSENVEYELE